MFTKFFDMSSGGREKEEYTTITVNLPEEEAVKWFEEKFGHHPYNVTCNCCGEDYSVSEAKELETLLKYTHGTYKHYSV